MRRWIALATATAATAAATSMFVIAPASADHNNSVKAVLKDADGDKVGEVTFKKVDKYVLVTANFEKDSNITKGTFHGFHIHANDNDATGDPGFGKDCKSPGNDPTKWFLSADGHYNTSASQTHGTHAGDMPSVLIRSNGKGYLSFTTDRIKVKSLEGKAVMLHAGADNFGNVPLDDADPAKYKANSPAATEKTAKTGNAGDRIACGVIKD